MAPSALLSLFSVGFEVPAISRSGFELPIDAYNGGSDD
jgi:hypothetical protein